MDPMPPSTSPRPTSTFPPEPAEIPPALARWGLAAAVALAGGLLAKQIAVAQVATRDATAYYLPLAREVASQGFDAQSPIIPPLYPFLVGLFAPLLSSISDQPLEFAGRLVSAGSAVGVVLVVYRLAGTLFSRRVALSTAVLTACNLWIIRLGGNVGPALLSALWIALTAWGLAEWTRRHRPIIAAGVGASAALAALTRSEAIFLLPLVAMVFLICLAIQHGRRKAAAGSLLAAVLVAAVLLAPRIAWMADRTGLPVLDARLAQVLPADWVETDLGWYRPPDRLARVVVGRPEGPDPPGDRIQEAAESLITVFGPATLILAGVWLTRGRGLASRTGIHLILLAIVLGELAMVYRVKMDRRYVVTVAPLVQLWGGAGLVALAESCRRRAGALGRFGRSVRAQLVGLGLLAAGLAVWSLLSTNVGTRHEELARLGRLAGEKDIDVMLCSSPEPAWYAGARWVRIYEAGPIDDPLSPDALLTLCATYDVDAVVIRSREQWAPWLVAMIEADALPAGTVLAQASDDDTLDDQGRPVVSSLLDVRRLRGALPQPIGP